MCLIQRELRIGDTTQEHRRAYFHIVNSNGEAVVTENGGQPQISIDGAPFTTSGIGTLNYIGSSGGVYYADLNIDLATNSGYIGKIITTNYVGASNPNSVCGTSFKVIRSMDGYDYDQILTAVLAYVAGQTAGAGTSSIAFKNPAGTTARITMSVDDNGERNSVALNV